MEQKSNVKVVVHTFEPPMTGGATYRYRLDRKDKTAPVPSVESRTPTVVMHYKQEHAFNTVDMQWHGMGCVFSSDKKQNGAKSFWATKDDVDDKHRAAWPVIPSQSILTPGASNAPSYYEMWREGMPGRLAIDVDFSRKWFLDSTGQYKATERLWPLLAYDKRELLERRVAAFCVRNINGALRGHGLRALSMATSASYEYDESETPKKASIHMTFHVGHFVDGEVIEYLSATLVASALALLGLHQLVDDEEFGRGHAAVQSLVVDGAADGATYPVIDASPYTKNRSFRLFGSTKMEKNLPLKEARLYRFDIDGNVIDNTYESLPDTTVDERRRILQLTMTTHVSHRVGGIIAASDDTIQAYKDMRNRRLALPALPSVTAIADIVLGDNVGKSARTSKEWISIGSKRLQSLRNINDPRLQQAKDVDRAAQHVVVWAAAMAEDDADGRALRRKVVARGESQATVHRAANEGDDALEKLIRDTFDLDNVCVESRTGRVSVLCKDGGEKLRKNMRLNQLPWQPSIGSHERDANNKACWYAVPVTVLKAALVDRLENAVYKVIVSANKEQKTLSKAHLDILKRVREASRENRRSEAEALEATPAAKRRRSTISAEQADQLRTHAVIDEPLIESWPPCIRSLFRKRSGGLTYNLRAMYAFFCAGDGSVKRMAALRFAESTLVDHSRPQQWKDTRDTINATYDQSGTQDEKLSYGCKSMAELRQCPLVESLKIASTTTSTTTVSDRLTQTNQKTKPVAPLPDIEELDNAIGRAAEKQCLAIARSYVAGNINGSRNWGTRQYIAMS